MTAVFASDSQHSLIAFQARLFFFLLFQNFSLNSFNLSYGILHLYEGICFTPSPIVFPSILIII